MKFQKLLIFLLLFFSMGNNYAQVQDVVNYAIRSNNRTVVIPLFYHDTRGNILYVPPVCFTVKSYNQDDSLTIKGAFDTTGYYINGFSGTGFPISLKRWDMDSVITGGIIYITGQDKGVKYQYSPFTPTCKYLLLQGNAYMTDTLYFETLFIK